jgi:cell wall-associated NlpC family hydrolase
MNWAITQAGHWYCWGGSGGCYDCSGLVMAAYAHAGISLPHSTYSMLSSGKLRWVPRSLARRGDLAFYGSGHVELLTRWPGMTFGAETFGTQVGWHKWNIWWHPTAFYRVG